MGWWRIGSGCLILPFPTRAISISRYAYAARGEQCVSRYTHLAHNNVCVTSHTARYTMYIPQEDNMRSTPHILYIIYKNGQKVRLNLGAQTPTQRQEKLNYWSKTVGARTAFLAWK